MSHRIIANFTQDAYEVLERLANGRTKTDVLRKALSLLRWIEEDIEGTPARLLIERDGDIREVVFP